MAVAGGVQGKGFLALDTLDENGFFGKWYPGIDFIDSELRKENRDVIARLIRSAPVPGRSNFRHSSW